MFTLAKTVLLSFAVVAVTACSNGSAGNDDPPPLDENALSSGETALDRAAWQCVPDATAKGIVDVRIRPILTGGAIAELSVSGASAKGFVETYRYSADVKAEGASDVSITGAQFSLKISAGQTASNGSVSGRLHAVGPKSADFYPNAAIDGGLTCLKLPTETISKRGQLCGFFDGVAVGCEQGLSCKSTCSAGAQCAIWRCEP